DFYKDRNYTSPIDRGANILRVHRINQPPITGPDLIELSGPALGSEIGINIAKLLANDSDPDGGTLTLTEFAAQSGQGYPVRREGNRLYYRAPSTAGPPDSFTYTVEDALGATAAGTVSILFLSNLNPPSNRVEVQALPGGDVRLIFAG